MKSVLKKQELTLEEQAYREALFQEKENINPLTGDTYDYTVKWYDRHLSPEQIEVKRQKAKERHERKAQRTTFTKAKFKFTPSKPPVDNPVMLKIAEAATISETNPHVKYRLACQQLSHYEHLCTEYNAGGFGIDTRTNVRQKRDYWQAEVDRLLIEII